MYIKEATKFHNRRFTIHTYLPVCSVCSVPPGAREPGGLGLWSSWLWGKLPQPHPAGNGRCVQGPLGLCPNTGETDGAREGGVWRRVRACASFLCGSRLPRGAHREALCLLGLHLRTLRRDCGQATSPMPPLRGGLLRADMHPLPSRLSFPSSACSSKTSTS